MRLRVAMRLRVNGEERELSLEDASVAGLLAALALPTPRVAVEVNGALVKRAEHAGYPLREGDWVEVVTLVGGG